MKILHDKVNRIYKFVKDLCSIEVLSEDHWEDVKSINITFKEKTIKLFTKNGKKLVCSPLHILIDENDNEIFAKDSLNKKIKTVDGVEVVNKIISYKDQNLYDLSLTGKNSTHTYYTNGFLSHNCVIVDEAAFIPKNLMDEFFASVMPIISSVKNSKAILVSTPNGQGNLYYDIWQQANNKNNKNNDVGWTPFRIDWWEVPGRDEKWKRQQIETVGMDKWRQEFCNEFAVGSESMKLIPDDIIEKYKMKLAEYKLRDLSKGKTQKFISPSADRQYEFTMWHEFDQNKTYMASGDVAEGTSNDNSVLYVWDVTDIRNIIQCAKFASPNVSPVEFAYVTNKILSLYNKPYFICESNGVGAGYLDTLSLTYEYPNIVRESKDNKLGITSHVQSKGRACLWLKDCFTTKGISWTIYDKDLLDEMTTFIKKDSKQHLVYNAIHKCHDDHIMSLCWGAWLLNPDIVDSYFIVAKSQTTDLDKIIPWLLEPLNEYREEDIKEIIEDPIYQQFLDYKKEMIKEFGDILKKENEAKLQVMDKNKYTFDQLFFNDDMDDCFDWRSGETNIGTPIQRAPIYTVNRGYW